MLPAPAPTLMIPAPERLRRFEKVPDELDVVLPSAVIDTDEVCTDAEIERTLAAVAVPIPAPAAMETLDEVPFNEKLVAAGTFGPTIVMACND